MSHKTLTQGVPLNCLFATGVLFILFLKEVSTAIVIGFHFYSLLVNKIHDIVGSKVENVSCKKSIIIALDHPTGGMSTVWSIEF